MATTKKEVIRDIMEGIEGLSIKELKLVSDFIYFDLQNRLDISLYDQD